MRNGIAAFLLLLFFSAVISYFLFGKPATYSFLLPKNDLTKSIDNILANTQGQYGIYIKNLKTGEIYSRDELKEFESGSLYKVWLMEAVFEEISKGKIKETDPISANVADLNKQFGIAKEDVELTEGVLNFSISSAVEQMITISHNYAALALANKIGQKNILNKVSAKVFGDFLEKLYKGEIVSAEYSQKMLDILSRQKINDRIPKYLPKDIKVAHKTANIGFFEHDGGIIYSEDLFIMVALTETKNPQDARDKIGRISEAAYKYFNK